MPGQATPCWKLVARLDCCGCDTSCPLLQVIGITEQRCETAEDLKRFYDDCMENRSTSSTKLNDR